MKTSTVPMTSKPWYKEPWPYYLALGPFIVLIAGFVTYYIAATTADSLVTDDYYKEGKNINLQLERDQVALANKVEANVMFSPDGKTARIFMNGTFDTTDDLSLHLMHPTLQQYDQSIKLTPNAINKNLYEAELKALPASKTWYVRIDDADSEWRIQGTWLTSQGPTVELSPLLAKVQENTNTQP